MDANLYSSEIDGYHLFVFFFFCKPSLLANYTYNVTLFYPNSLKRTPNIRNTLTPPPPHPPPPPPPHAPSPHSHHLLHGLSLNSNFLSGPLPNLSSFSSLYLLFLFHSSSPANFPVSLLPLASPTHLSLHSPQLTTISTR